MNIVIFGVKNSQEMEWFTSCHNPRVEDRKEPKFGILLQEQSGVQSFDMRSLRKFILGTSVIKKFTHLEIFIPLSNFTEKMKKSVLNKSEVTDNEKSKMSGKCKGKGNQISKELQDFLKLSRTLFGDYITNYLENILKDLSAEKQYDLAWHILHYMYSDEILPTGDSDVDIKLSEIIEKLPPINVEIFRSISQQKFGKPKKDVNASQYAS